MRRAQYSQRRRRRASRQRAGRWCIRGRRTSRSLRMPIDREKALAHVFPAGEGAYTRDDVILYHLGIGAGNPATDPNELAYTYEKVLKVLPTFAVVARSGGGGGPMSIP